MRNTPNMMFPSPITLYSLQHTSPPSHSDKKQIFGLDCSSHRITFGYPRYTPSVSRNCALLPKSETNIMRVFCAQVMEVLKLN